MTDATNPSPKPYPNAPFPHGPTGEDPLPASDVAESRGASHEQSTSPVDDAAAAKDAAKQKAINTAQTGKQAAGEVADTAADAAKDLAQETSAQAKDLLDKTRTQVGEQAAAQQSSLAATLRDLGDQLAGMADTDQYGAAVQLVADAGGRARDAADWLDHRDPGQVVDELRELGRRRPGAFLLGSAVAGIVAGRLSRGVAAAHSDDAGPTSSTPSGARHEARG